MISNAVSNAVSNETAKTLLVGLDLSYASSDKNRYVAPVFTPREPASLIACRVDSSRNPLLQLAHNQTICVASRRGANGPSELAGQRHENKQVGAETPPAMRRDHDERPTCFMSAKELLTINAVAAELKVSRSTVYRLIAARDLPAVQVRGCRRVSRTAVDRYISGLERSAHVAQVVVRDGQ